MSNIITNIVEFVVFAIVLLLFVALIITNISTRLQNNKLKATLKQEVVDRAIVMEEMKKLMEELDGKSSNQNEGFLKFVSESRDWAFQYIERVQISIKKFQDVFHPFAEQYYENKRTRIPKEEFPAVVEAYRKLIEELPEEGKR